MRQSVFCPLVTPTSGGYHRNFLFVLLSPQSERNQQIFTKVKEILRKEHGAENCPWTDLQMEGLY